ncbi:MAG TPA: sulfite exporter TauE/SafE family protein [Xanthomonadales bacterium]|nr:sulfite exporter TauE/SafE family protein [Xanthomonadales bacterium]
MSTPDVVLAALFFAIAALYSSVGHAGASGYIAAMALLSLPATTVKPTALALNVLVASIGIVRFGLARLVPWKLVLPLVAASAPAAYFGASLHLEPQVYQRALAAVLALAAIQLARTARVAPQREVELEVRPLPWPLALAIGAGIGVVSGITGTGGAIFLTPLLLFARFATTRIASGASVAFVLANSVSGLGALAPAAGGLPGALPLWLGAVALGALVGTQLGRGALPVVELRKVLAIVLVIAAGKLALT